jgi:hypothetical protein
VIVVDVVSPLHACAPRTRARRLWCGRRVDPTTDVWSLWTTSLRTPPQKRSPILLPSETEQSDSEEPGRQHPWAAWSCPDRQQLHQSTPGQLWSFPRFQRSQARVTETSTTCMRTSRCTHQTDRTSGIWMVVDDLNHWLQASMKQLRLIEVD